MFGNDKSIDNLQELFSEVKRYLQLQKEYTMLDITEKLTVILSTLISIFVFIILGMIALLYLSFTFAYMLEPYVGLTGSFAIITGIIIFLIIIVIIFKKRLIVHPLTNFLAKLLLNKK